MRLRNPRYYSDGVVNVTTSDEGLPKMQECNQPRRVTEEDMATYVFEYVLTQYGLVRGLQKYGFKREEAEKELTQIHSEAH